MNTFKVRIHKLLQLHSFFLLSSLIKIAYLRYVLILDGVNSGVIEADIIYHPLGECIHELIEFREADAHILSGMQWAANLGHAYLL